MDKRLLTIIKKELKRVFTDRRLVFSTMLLPAISIFIMYSLMGNMVSNLESDVEGNLHEVVVVNQPETFSNYLIMNQAKERFVFTRGADIGFLKESLMAGDYEVVLDFGQTFDQDVENLNKSELEVYYNPSEEYSRNAKYLLEDLLRGYEAYLLGERFNAPDHIDVFETNLHGVEDPQKAVGKALSSLFPMLIAMFLFAGAMSVGADIIAGEKERGTMATLLVTPIDRETIALGKIIALIIIAFISALSSFIGIFASLPRAGKIFSDSGMEMSALSFGLSDFLMLGAIMLSLVAMYVAIICVVSVLAKSVKEANTYMAPIYMVVVISGFTTMYTSDMPVWRLFIPIYGGIIALKSLFTFELTLNMLLYVCGSSLLVTVIGMYLIRYLFNNETVMFRK